MGTDDTDDVPIRRRSVLSTTGAALAGGLALGAGTRTGRAQSALRLVQDDVCVPLVALSGDVPVEEFYAYHADGSGYSSDGSITRIEAPKTSRLFLYAGPDGTTSLVFVHGKHQRGETPVGGGAVSMHVEQLPEDGAWVVKDDKYAEVTNFDRWNLDDTAATIHWTWTAGHSDGGVFAGFGTDGTAVIEPAFNEAAALYEKHYHGDVKRWQALTGGLDDPEAVPLDMGEPVVIEPGSC